MIAARLLLALALAAGPALAAPRTASVVGMEGPAGPPGPKASQFVCSATIGESTLVALGSGIRIVQGIACPGVLTTDLLEVYPTAPASFPAGYAVHHALPTAANTFKAVLSAPPLSIGASYAIPVAIYAVNR